MITEKEGNVYNSLCILFNKIIKLFLLQVLIFLYQIYLQLKLNHCQNFDLEQYPVIGEVEKLIATLDGEEKIGAHMDYLKCTALRKNASAASNCIGCGKCEAHCPQGIAIRRELKEAQKVLETPVFKVAQKFIGWFMKF